MLDECITEEQRSGVPSFCGQKDAIQRIFIKKCFLFTVGSVCRVKRFTTGPRNSQGRLKAADDVTKVRNWLRQQPKDFCAAGFDALEKRREKCTNVGGGYAEECFFPGSNITRFTFYIHLRPIY
jgi:hypothetical protein